MSQARLRKIFHESLPVELLKRRELDSAKLLNFINLFVSCMKSNTYSQRMTDMPFAIVLDPDNHGTGNCFLNPTEMTHVLNQWSFSTCNVIAVDYEGLKTKDIPFIVDGEDIASGLSKSHDLILFYINKLAVSVFVDGECVKSTLNIHTMKRTGQIRNTDKPPSQYKDLILDHFNNKIDKGKSFDYWATKKDRILKSKPEAYFRNILLSYLQDNLTPEGVARKEIPVGNTDDKVDIEIIDMSSNEFIYIEIKWMGKARKEFKKEETTNYGDESPNDGLKQLCIYLDTGRAKSGCLLTYDARSEDKEIKWNMSESEWHNNLDKPPMRLYLKSDSASVESKKSDNQGKKKQQGKGS